MIFTVCALWRACCAASVWVCTLRYDRGSGCSCCCSYRGCFAGIASVALSVDVAAHVEVGVFVEILILSAETVSPTFTPLNLVFFPLQNQKHNVPPWFCSSAPHPPTWSARCNGTCTSPLCPPDASAPNTSWEHKNTTRRLKRAHSLKTLRGRCDEWSRVLIVWRASPSHPQQEQHRHH